MFLLKYWHAGTWSPRLTLYLLVVLQHQPTTFHTLNTQPLHLLKLPIFPMITSHAKFYPPEITYSNFFLGILHHLPRVRARLQAQTLFGAHNQSTLGICTCTGHPPHQRPPWLKGKELSRANSCIRPAKRLELDDPQSTSLKRLTSNQYLYLLREFETKLKSIRALLLQRDLQHLGMQLSQLRGQFDEITAEFESLKNRMFAMFGH